MSRKHWPIIVLILLAGSLATGCADTAPVQPPAAEQVPADAPVGEEKPSTDEM